MMDPTDFTYRDRYIFLGEWFQKDAQLIRPFQVYYFPTDNAVELFDLRTRKQFLRRARVEGITEKDFYIGAKLNIFGRQIDITDFGDSQTKNLLGAKRQNAFIMLKPEALGHLGKIIKKLNSNRFTIQQCKMVKMHPHDATKFYVDLAGDSILPFLMVHLSSGPVIVMELIADNAYDKLVEICGPEDPLIAKEKAADTMRALYGIDLIKNAIHFTDKIENINREVKFFFSPEEMIKQNLVFSLTAKYERSTLCIIKPHAIKECKAGDIITTILECGFDITAMKLFIMDRANCEEFYEVYKGVVPEYVQMVAQLTTGPCIAMEIQAQNPEVNSYSAFRDLCGPADPEVAKQLRPNSLRSLFGITKVENAVHCTDLEEDTVLEVEYFFKIL